MSGDASSALHTAGRSGLPNRRHLRSSVSCGQGTPAGLPFGKPGMGDEIEMTIQQAAQPGRHSMRAFAPSEGLIYDNTQEANSA